MRKFSHLTGFTLVEMTVVLAVIATILGSAIAMVSASLEGRAYNNTLTRLDELKQALLEYRIANNRLPCPANYATYAVTDTNFGVEAATTGNCAGGTPAADDSDAAAASGMIPVRTLGLPDELAFDSWGRRIRYVVSTPYTETDSFDGANRAVSDTTTRLTVANNDSGATLSTTATYVLVSGGANGHGMRGGLTGTLVNAAITNINELLNCKCSSTGAINVAADLDNFAHGSPLADTTNPLNNFDDVVAFGNRAELRDATE